MQQQNQTAHWDNERNKKFRLEEIIECNIGYHIC